jgi:DNA-binding SARP family transcriptional activator
MRFGILGPVELWSDGRRLPVGGSRQLALLAFLVLHADRSVSSLQLHEALWSDLHP